MTRDEAIARARHIAEAEGWTWLSPVEATLTTVRGDSRQWVVTTNASGRGCNVRITLDDVTGTTLSKAYAPR